MWKNTKMKAEKGWIEEEQKMLVPGSRLKKQVEWLNREGLDLEGEFEMLRMEEVGVLFRRLRRGRG